MKDGMKEKNSGHPEKIIYKDRAPNYK